MPLHLQDLQRFDSTQNGYVTLIGVLVVAAVGFAIAISLLTLGLGSSQTSVVELQSTQARSLADACIEEGLFQLKGDPLFSGSGSLTLGDGTCSYEVIEEGVGLYRVHGTGTVQDVVQRSEATGVRTDGGVTVDSWKSTPLFSM